MVDSNTSYLDTSPNLIDLIGQFIPCSECYSSLEARDQVPYIQQYHDSVSLSHVDNSSIGAVPAAGVVRFLKTCQNIESDLRAISVEAKRKHPEIKSLAERALLKVGDFKDRRELLHRTGEDAPDSNSNIIVNQHQHIGIEGRVFPTWNILSAVGAVGYIVNSGNTAMTKSLLHSLSLLQRLLSLWQQQQQTRKQSGWMNNYDVSNVFLTEDHLEVILKFLYEQSGVSNTIQLLSGISYRRSKQSHNVNLIEGQYKISPDFESIQLKILQTILSLFSIDTPLLTFLPISSHSRSNSILLAKQTSDSSISDPPNLSSVKPNSPMPFNSEHSCRLAIQRVRQLLSLLVSLHAESPFPSVRHTASAGMSQFFRYALDSAASAVNAALRRSLNDKHVINDPIRLTDSDICLVTVTYVLILQLCNLADITNTQPNSDQQQLQQQQQQQHVEVFSSIIEFLNLKSLLEPTLGLQLLGSAFISSSSLFLIHPLFDQLLDRHIEPLLLKLLSCPNLNFSNNLRVLRLLQSYWLHLADLRLRTERPNELLLWILKALEGEFDSFAPISWRRVGAMAFLRWLVEQQGIVSKLLLPKTEGETIDLNQSPENQYKVICSDMSVFSRIIEYLGKTIHEVCFSFGSEDSHLLLDSLNCGSLRLPPNLVFPLLRLSPSHETFKRLTASLQSEEAHQMYLPEINSFGIVINESLVPLMTYSMSQWAAEAQRWQQLNPSPRPCPSYSVSNLSVPNFTSSSQLLEILDHESNMNILSMGFGNELDGNRNSNQRVSTTLPSIHSTDTCSWTPITVNTLLLRLSTETLICIISSMMEEMLLSRLQQLFCLQHSPTALSSFDVSSIFQSPLVISPNGLLLYSPLQFPLTRCQSSVMNTLTISWGPILSGLSLLLNSLPMESGLIDLLVISFQSLICLSSIFNIDGCLSSCIHTLNKIVTSPIRSISTSSIYSHELFASHSSNKESPSSTPDISHQSTRFNSPGGLFIPESISFTPTQLLCWKSLLCSAQHFGSIINRNGWRILLQTFNDLHEVLYSGRITFTNPSNIPPFKSCFFSGIEYSLMDCLQSPYPLLILPSSLSPTKPNLVFSPSKTSEITLLEGATSSLFRQSSILLLTEESVNTVISELQSLILNQPSNNILIPFEFSTQDETLPLIPILNQLIQMSSQQDNQQHPNQLIIKSESGFLGYIIELFYGIGCPSLISILSSENNDNRIAFFGYRFSTSESFFPFLQLIQIVHHNSYRLHSCETAVLLTRPLKVCLDPRYSTTQRYPLDAEGLIRFQLETATVLGRIVSMLIEANQSPTVGCVNREALFDTETRSLEQSKVQCILLGSLIDVFAETSSVQIKKLILESLYSLLRSSGMYITSDLSWSLIIILAGLATSQCFKSFETSFCQALQQPCISITSFGSEQSNVLFNIVEILIRDFCDSICSSTALSLLVSIIASLARTHHLGNNVSFSAVGLLWTLAEALSNPKPKECSEWIRAQGSLLPSDSVFGIENQKMLFISIDNVAVPLPIHSNQSQSIKSVDFIILEIFSHLRRLTVDSRVEVRNCSLRSLVAAYNTSHSSSTNEEFDSKRITVTNLVDEVGLILVGALQDVSEIYEALMKNNEGQILSQETIQQQMNEPSVLLHHSRNSIIKLWDESAIVIIEGVSRIILDKSSTSLDTTTEITLLHQASTSLCQFLEALLTAPLTRTSDILPVSTEVYIVAMKVLTRIASLPCARRITISCRDKGNDPKHEQRCWTLWNRCWEIFELASDVLWNESLIADRLIDSITKSIQILSESLLIEYSNMEDFNISGREFMICVRLLLILLTSTSRSGHLLPPPPPQQFAPPSLPHDEILNDSLQSLIEALKVHFGTETDCWDFLKRIGTLEDVHCNSIQSNETSLQSSATFHSEISSTINSEIRLVTNFSNLEGIRASRLLPSYQEWRLRSQQFHPSRQPTSQIIELFIPRDSPVLSDQSVVSNIPRRVTDLDRDTINESNIQSEIPYFPCFSQLCKFERKLSSFSRSIAGFRQPSQTQQHTEAYDDDFSSTPQFLHQFDPHSDDSVHPIRSRSCIPNSDLSQIRELLSISMTSAMKICRCYIPCKRLHSTDVACIELLESLSWEQLLIHHPWIWLNLLYQITESLLDIIKIKSHTSTLLIAARTINALTRILRSLPHIIGTASYLVLSRIFSLFKAGVRLPFLNLYAFECLLQVLLDLKQLCVISTQSTRSLSSSSLNVVWAVVSVGLNSAYRAWESEATCEPPTPTAHGAKFPRFGAPESVAQLLRVVRCYLGLNIDDRDGKSSFAAVTSLPLPKELFNVLINILDQLVIVGSRSGLEEMSQTSLQTMFDVCDQLGMKDDSLLRLRVAANTLCHRVRALLNRFILDDSHSGQCPLPRQRLEELIFVLSRLRSLRLPPSAFFDGENSDKLRLTAELAGDRTHIIILLPDLIKLISTKDGTVRKELQKVLHDTVAGLCGLNDEDLRIVSVTG